MKRKTSEILRKISEGDSEVVLRIGFIPGLLDNLGITTSRTRKGIKYEYMGTDGTSKEGYVSIRDPLFDKDFSGAFLIAHELSNYYGSRGRKCSIKEGTGHEYTLPFLA